MCLIFVQIKYITPRVSINVNCQLGSLWYINAGLSVVTNVGSSSSKEWTEGREYVRNLCVCSVIQLCLCDPMDCSLPGFSVSGIFQARILVWIASSYFRGFSWPKDQTQVSCIACRFFTTGPVRSKRGNLYTCLSILLWT